MARIAGRRCVPRSVRPAVNHSSETMTSQTEPRPSGSSLPLRSYAEAKLAARLKKISSTLRRAAKDPDDPENIHDLRVAIRRFTQALRVFKDLLDRGRV